MKAAVITFPGSNCDDDCVYALEEVCELSVDRIWHKHEVDLSPYSLIVLPGGFSYGDYLRCGSLAAFSPIMNLVRAASDRGQLILGICNGFQILCEANLLPGALVPNSSLRFICKDVTLKVENNLNPWLNAFKVGDVLTLPIAHGDGRYVIGDQAQAAKAQKILSYCDAKGALVDGANPNGSFDFVAGMVNEKGNVFGLMPHPERAADLRSLHGRKLFESIINHLREKASA